MAKETESFGDVLGGCCDRRMNGSIVWMEIDAGCGVMLQCVRCGKQSCDAAIRGPVRRRGDLLHRSQER